MSRVFALLAVVGVLVVPVLVGAQDYADGEDRIPREANWSPVPATPPLLAVQQPRTASASPEPVSVRAPAAAYENAGGEDRIPPEARWSPVPATPPTVAVQQPRAVSTAPERSAVRSPAAASSQRIDYRGEWDEKIYGDKE